MSLHLVFNSAGFNACQQRMLSADPIILLGDGVYSADASSEQNIYILALDAQVRGVILDPSQFNLIDYDAFVALTAAHLPVVSWAE
ncbi:MAG: sulfur relay protein TusB/DsrH [Candidatus Azotimanducaceae bacterium]|jgi:sulfur relay protein TusB/DsrH|tara:strand:- start:736 stop:993 length:258 start_codon:yes stop_codon:yes gene_type:complete